MRHVPKSTTKECDCLSFDEALAQALVENVEYDVKKWLYVPNTYCEYRYVLGTRGANPLIVVGVNPSTAAPDALDPTLQSAERIAHSNGYDSFLMLNVYPQRATDPNDMEKNRNYLNICSVFRQARMFGVHGVMSFPSEDICVIA